MKTRPADDTAQWSVLDWDSADYDEPVDQVEYDFSHVFGAGMSRRRFVQALGAGLLITVALDSVASAQEAPRREGRGGGGNRGGGGFRGGPPAKVAARLHIGQDGVITVFTGKVEAGQGARAELTQAAAEELRVPADRINLVMADTSLVPNDGSTAGSGSTPRTLPAIRQGAAAARDLLVAVACHAWQVQPAEVEVADGKVVHAPSARGQSYAELAASEDAVKAFDQTAPQGVSITPVAQWKVLGVSTPRPNRRDLVTGKHEYPSDIKRPGMLYGKVLRPPSYGAQLTAVDLGPAKEMKGVVPVRDGSFVGVVAPSSFLADDALDAIAGTAKWDTKPHPPSTTVFDYLRAKARGGMPANPFASDFEAGAKKLRQAYNVAYVQHAPMEPRAAVAEWDNGKVTVWTATQNPFGVRSEVARAFEIPEERVRVVVPDFGGGFGGKHSGECAVEAARLAKAAGKPVSLRWTRQEEFTWAYFRPAAAINAEASLDAEGNIATWHFVNVNSGPSAVETPYRCGKGKSEFVQSEPPLRHGSYRALASTANVFARECFMDELAELAGKDPLAFRLAHLGEPRLRAVLEEAAKRFDWPARAKEKKPNVGVGLACGTEKGSYVAACAEVEVDRAKGSFRVLRVCQAYECGKIVNPKNLLAQVEGAIVQGLGPALREEIRFEDGKVTNAALSQYLVPRFEDVPELEIHLLDRPDLPSTGAGETPIIAVAPAVANALWRVTGQRAREMPIRLAKA
jgi:isoquinoline 1-oxidoreductase